MVRVDRMVTLSRWSNKRWERRERRPAEQWVVMEVPRLRTRPPAEVDGYFLRRYLSPQRTTNADRQERSDGAQDGGGRHDSGHGLWNDDRGSRRGGAAVCGAASSWLRTRASREQRAGSCPVVSWIGPLPQASRIRQITCGGLLSRSRGFQWKHMGHQNPFHLRNRATMFVRGAAGYY